MVASKPSRAVVGGDVVAAAERAMDDMGRAAGLRAGLVDLGAGEQFGQRRARQAVGAPVGDAGRLHLGHRGAHRLVVLVVDAGRQAGRRDRRKAVVEQGGGMRGKRFGSVPKVENLKAATPASTCSAMRAAPSSGSIVP